MVATYAGSLSLRKFCVVGGIPRPRQERRDMLRGGACTRRVSLAGNVVIPDRRAQGSPSMAVRKDMAPPDGPKFHGIREDSTTAG